MKENKIVRRLLFVGILVLAIMIVFPSVGAGFTQYEAYTTGADGAIGLITTSWNSQTFTIGNTGDNRDHYVTSVKLLMYRAGSPGTATCGIRAVDGGGLPTGSDLCSATLNANFFTTSTSGAYYEFTFSTPYSLSSSTKYAIVLRVSGGDVTNKLYWLCDGSTPAYTGGSRCYSSNSGLSWTADTTRDFNFYEYGNAAPSFLNPSPSNGVTLDDVPQCSVHVSDDDSTFTLYWYEGTDGTHWTYAGKNSSISDGTYYHTYSLDTSTPGHYYWKYAANDGTSNVSASHDFYYILKIVSHVEEISPYNYYNDTVNLTITIDKGYPKFIYLYYLFSKDNSSWIWAADPINLTSSPYYYVFDFTDHALGYYGFACTGYNNISTPESPGVDPIVYCHKFMCPPQSMGPGGWDIVSLPYSGTMSLSNATLRIRGSGHNYTWADAVAAGVIMNTLYGYDETHGWYTIDSFFQGYKGYWMYFFDQNYDVWVPDSLSGGGDSSYIVNITLMNVSSFNGWTGGYVDSHQNISVLVTEDMELVGDCNATSDGPAGFAVAVPVLNIFQGTILAACFFGAGVFVTRRWSQPLTMDAAMPQPQRRQRRR